MAAGEPGVSLRGDPIRVGIMGGRGIGEQVSSMPLLFAYLGGEKLR
ncbi:hypothetical protein KSF_045220 [Reticulibacter mediterranei]|uniref:Uncharacterized protein n=1 Tax=Reticulibacter mediterranei TaxID=2778369 RepID=A0A8J3IMW0_9CHLR|nr:hypothetical protein KSF_045220 [Reticulibacter mediterranei]